MPLQPKFLNRTVRPITLSTSLRANEIRQGLWKFKPLKPNQLVDGIFEGGGALGAAYIGALTALHDNNIWFARVAGNSAGSITAAMIAAGFTAPEIQWLTSGFPNAPEPPRTLISAGITTPIPFSDFLDLPTLNTVKQSSMRKTLLWKALKGTVIDEIAKMPLPILTRAQAVERCVKDLKDLPVLGAVLLNIPGVDDLLRQGLNLGLLALPTDPLRVGNFLPNTDRLRSAFADTLWTAIAMNVPVELLLANLLHEGSLFEGDKFLDTIKQLFGRKVHQNPDATVLFEDLQLPLAVIATDTKQGRMVIYSSKTHPKMEVAEAVRQSMSVPFVFQPRDTNRRIADGRFVDGGLCANFPLWLFTAGGQDYVTQCGNDEIRPKIGFVLQEGLDAKPIWNVQPSKFTPTGSPPRVDDMPVIRPILVEKLRALGLQSSDGTFSEPSVLQDLANLKLIKEISGVVGIDKEESTRTFITKAMMKDSAYFDIVIPLLGYHWLDFYVNQNEDDILAMWDRGWHATVDVLGTAPLTGVGQPLIANANLQQSPFLVA
jgi:predicted acylesterase/phospholipase RssA